MIVSVLFNASLHMFNLKLILLELVHNARVHWNRMYSYYNTSILPDIQLLVPWMLPDLIDSDSLSGICIEDFLNQVLAFFPYMRWYCVLSIHDFLI